MSAQGRGSLVSTWYGSFVLRDGKVLHSALAPREAAALAQRVKQRLDGRLTEEDRAVAERVQGSGVVSPDRRFGSLGVPLVAHSVAPPGPLPREFSAALHREVLLTVAAESLKTAWDPSIHVEEAVRAGADLDRVLNLMAERLTSWASRDSIASDAAVSENPGEVAREIAAGTHPESGELPALDPALIEARRALARLYLETRAARDALEDAVSATLPHRAPNLSRLLGPDLAARLISLAGGLDRLARLPASTVQVLGAERAFFEHLRGHGSSPRHGVLFLHPQIQSARRPQRGKLARALAGKAAIAARLDLAGTAPTEDLARAFEARAAAIRAAPARGSTRPRRKPSGLPLDRAPEDR